MNHTRRQFFKTVVVATVTTIAALWGNGIGNQESIFDKDGFTKDGFIGDGFIEDGLTEDGCYPLHHLDDDGIWRRVN